MREAPRVARLACSPAHLGRGGRAFVEPEFTGDMSWYEAYAARHDADGVEGWLVSTHVFRAPWDSWEMHPAGDEIVFCAAGAITLIQDNGTGADTRIELGPGDYAVNDAGVWHTADVECEAQLVFITSGQGTRHRPR